MGLSNLSKILDKYEKQLGYNDSSLNQFARLKGLPFYDWASYSTGKHSNTEPYQSLRTFNHAIGLPQKNGVSYPLFDYEQMLFDTLQSNKHVWIKKATGSRSYRVHAAVYGLAFRKLENSLRITDVHCNRAQNRISDHTHR